MIWWVEYLPCFYKFDTINIYQGILNEVWKHKLIFVETPDANETSIALENYRRVSKGFTIYSTLI